MAVFSVNFEMNDKGLATFFKYKIFTISTEITKNWNLKQIYEKGLKEEFRLGVDQNILMKYKSNTELYELLDEINQLDVYFTIQNSKGIRYNEKTQYIKCVLPEIILGYLKKYL